MDPQYDDVFDRFCRCLQDGCLPNLREQWESYHGEHRHELLLEMVETEAVYRVKRRGLFHVNEYQERFPEVTGEELERLLALVQDCQRRDFRARQALRDREGSGGDYPHLAGYMNWHRIDNGQGGMGQVWRALHVGLQ